MPPCINATISIIENLQHNFPKMREGSKALWNFSKQSSNLTARPFPNWDEQEPVVLESPAILNLDPDLLFDGDVMWGCGESDDEGGNVVRGCDVGMW